MNYYFKLKPTKEQKDNIVELINNEKFDEAEKISKTFLKKHLGRLYPQWKFLFKLHGAFYYVNKSTLFEFLNSPNVVIEDEYGNAINFQEFWDKVLQSYEVGSSNKQVADVIKIDDLEFLDCNFC